MQAVLSSIGTLIEWAIFLGVVVVEQDTLFRTKRLCRVYGGGAASGKQTGSHSDGCNEQRNSNKRQWVCCGYTVQKAGQKPPHRKRCGKADEDAKP